MSRTYADFKVRRLPGVNDVSIPFVGLSGQYLGTDDPAVPESLIHDFGSDADPTSLAMALAGASDANIAAFISRVPEDAWTALICGPGVLE